MCLANFLSEIGCSCMLLYNISHQLQWPVFMNQFKAMAPKSSSVSLKWIYYITRVFVSNPNTFPSPDGETLLLAIFCFLFNNRWYLWQVIRIGVGLFLYGKFWICWFDTNHNQLQQQYCFNEINEIKNSIPFLSNKLLPIAFCHL